MRTKKDTIESVVTYLTYDQRTNKKWLSPFCKKTHKDIRYDAEKIVDIVLSDTDFKTCKCKGGAVGRTVTADFENQICDRCGRISK